MNTNTAMVLMNLGVLTLTGLIFYWTKSWWALAILLCMFSHRNSK